MSTRAALFIDFITGREIRGIEVQEHWFDRELSDPVNVVFLQFDDGRWARMFFDAGVFFWREVDAPSVPEPFDNQNIKLRHEPFSGRVSHATLQESFNAAELSVELTNGHMLRLRNSNDQSSLDLLPEPTHP